MKTINADEVKHRAAELGADLCGIASIDRFNDAPAGFHSADVIKGCKSVIVTAARFPVSSLSGSSQAAYTFVRNVLVAKMDGITFQLAAELEKLGSLAVPIPSSDPYDFWDDTRRHGQGIVSLKHAAVRAGLGRMGKNTLLVNNQYGNMIWLGAVLVNKDLAADTLAAYQPCSVECRICLDACPAQALDGASVVQRKCREISGKCTPGGGMVYECNLCRKLCPQHQGIE
jgi:epoxyqueuosine reductase